MNKALAEISQWAELLRPFWHILLVWLLAWLVLRSLRRALAAFKLHIVHKVERGLDGPDDFRRIETLTNVFRYAAGIVVFGVAAMLTLGEIGISITPILATAGVAGIAIGFGAQSLVKDFFTGLFLLLENQVSEGDVIEVAGKSGYVERVTLRHIRIRDYDGSVHFIPNGMITTVTNRSREYAYAVIDLAVGRQQDLECVFGLMREAGAAMRRDPAFGAMLLGDVDIAGVEKVEDAAMTLRCRLKVKPARQWSVRREFLRRMKLALDREQPAAPEA
ncbi:mechanosensitive ion channel family protein [Noviherbaspirillum autotrophicum]|uniref:Mechanosensitive ion channel protein MscS n=1 Tax=Noviherbaspirillum autotrophicum TaxID=709839 RepID=A0A0C2BMV0_9BURK|nr:mechanosensitive ion channel family protein [Noviherbaspirillum autotrophicum]KIF81354.1 mechanosensitive ion channel protein MscS [Noviherbaspirillum autotrophicum]